MLQSHKAGGGKVRQISIYLKSPLGDLGANGCLEQYATNQPVCSSQGILISFAGPN